MATALVVVNKKTKESESFPSLLLNELLKHCDDYETLKTIQLSTSALNNLFTCPSQSIWKQLCLRNRYTFLLKQEARCLLRRTRLIWESIYYQNWKVDLNWSNKRCENKTIFSGSLIKLVNSSLGILLPVVDGNVSICDLKRGVNLFSKRVKGQVTSSNLQGNWLVLGKSCGSMTIFKVFSADTLEFTVKHHSKEISALLIDIKENSVISGDVGGQIIKSNIGNIGRISILYQGESGVTGLHLKDEIIFVTTMDGSLIKIFKTKGECFKIKVYNFNNFGSINCISSYGTDSIVLGTDSGNLITLNSKNIKADQRIEHLTDSPIISLASSLKRIAAGHFNGKISVLCAKIREKNMFNEFGPVWSLGIDDTSLISCSLNGGTILRNFL